MGAVGVPDRISVSCSARPAIGGNIAKPVSFRPATRPPRSLRRLRFRLRPAGSGPVSTHGRRIILRQCVRLTMAPATSRPSIRVLGLGWWNHTHKAGTSLERGEGRRARSGRRRSKAVKRARLPGAFDPLRPIAIIPRRYVRPDCTSALPPRPPRLRRGRLQEARVFAVAVMPKPARTIPLRNGRRPARRSRSGSRYFNKGNSSAGTSTTS
jgi:hypothetical protein